MGCSWRLRASRWEPEAAFRPPGPRGRHMPPRVGGTCRGANRIAACPPGQVSRGRAAAPRKDPRLGLKAPIFKDTKTKNKQLRKRAREATWCLVETEHMTGYIDGDHLRRCSENRCGCGSLKGRWGSPLCSDTRRVPRVTCTCCARLLSVHELWARAGPAGLTWTSVFASPRVHTGAIPCPMSRAGLCTPTRFSTF